MTREQYRQPEHNLASNAVMVRATAVRMLNLMTQAFISGFGNCGTKLAGILRSNKP
ncbi:hypothetical protein [Mycobacterium riyadhense]|uniref:Uncharacterized protein n=1 Tax=Mycobacterium riyadhense TaxID=486698 RepID=A0A653F4N8_9MYCO|nr:hypothetical protein [Mycobacterium riyadhense]VTP04735.1 hypothetical protein BIN_B_05688 [Mycobacterium riyadhense]